MNIVVFFLHKTLNLFQLIEQLQTNRDLMTITHVLIDYYQVDPWIILCQLHRLTYFLINILYNNINENIEKITGS